MSLHGWHQLTWEEISLLPAQGMDGAILPVGATEQHGPHLGCGVDTEIAHQLCRVAAEISEVALLPPCLMVVPSAIPGAGRVPWRCNPRP